VRIIAGQYKGRVLKSPPSTETRPTSDRLRESLFNVLAPRIAGAIFLDLCAGSGAVGIEALSRGAEHVTFVDKSRKMCELIAKNLTVCRVPPDQTSVIAADASQFVLKQRRGSRRWDLVYYDPPYNEEYSGVLAALGAPSSDLLQNEALVVCEHHKKTNLPDAIGKLERYRVLKQGDSTLSFYKVTEQSV
jgi:16S rRNA (guanine(966)-N(2))-methyltransferase RsmD